MIKSLLYKEWIKSRWVLLIVTLIFAAVVAYIFMGVSRGLRVAGVDHIWIMIITKGITFTDTIKYIPIFAGLVLALAQFLPEIVQKRLKLTLHLPLSETKIFATMLGYGLITLLLLFGLFYAILVTGMHTYFSPEISQWNMNPTLPWFLGGLATYLLAVWICVEPVWEYRVINGILAVTLVSAFYFAGSPEAYRYFIPFIALFVLCSTLFSFNSLSRFKDGEQ